jgi:hypothetical protein
MHDGCQRRATVQEWPAEFRPYAPGYQPRFGRRKVSTRPIQEPKPSPASKLTKEEKAQAAPKKDSTVVKWKRYSVLVVQDLPPIPWRFNPYLNEEKRLVLHTHLTKISDEYASMELEKIRPPKDYLPF